VRGRDTKAHRWGRAGLRWVRLVARPARKPGLRVFYGWDRIPGQGEQAAGGTAKLQKLAVRFPNHPSDFSLLYLGTTYLPRDLEQLLRLARKRGIPVVVNQDGVAYPGWAGTRVEELNAPLRRAVLAADHVVFQSEFSRRCSDLFLGETRGTWEVLPNAVDTDFFSPSATAPDGGPRILLGGDQTQAYRLELGLETLRRVLDVHPEARLLISGRLVSDPEPTLGRLGLHDHVDWLGSYTQREAPALFRGAHLLLHPKVNDPCPTTVIEAMACGLPVVYAASGGTTELVTDEAGIGVPHDDGFERDSPPTAEALAGAVVTAFAAREALAAGARRRAVERFGLEAWLDRHSVIFDELIARRPS
jgi:glycosyltransferase involved in cell wall biosynthesis